MVTAALCFSWTKNQEIENWFEAHLDEGQRASLERLGNTALGLAAFLVMVESEDNSASPSGPLNVNTW